VRPDVERNVVVTADDPNGDRVETEGGCAPCELEATPVIGA
jgi:hypothetical protein